MLHTICRVVSMNPATYLKLFDFGHSLSNRSTRILRNMSNRSFRIFLTRNDIPPRGVAFLQGKNVEIEQWNSENTIPRDELKKRVKDVDAIFCTLNDKIGLDVIESAGSRLKVIGTMSVGADHIDTKVLKEKNIKLGYTPEVLTDASAELVISLTLMTLRRTYEAAVAAKDGKWPHFWGPLWMCGKMILGSKIGFVGFGRIAQAVATRLKPFRPSAMLYHCLNRKGALETEMGVTWCGNLKDLLSQSDIVIVLCALNNSTRNLMSKDKLELMKRGSHFINVSRGAIVDQDGLVELLHKGHFGGVGLDVTTPEPLPKDHPLFSFKECVILPHIASSCVETRETMSELTAKNIWAALSDEKMPAEWKL